jgi:hypothetical protein
MPASMRPEPITGTMAANGISTSFTEAGSAPFFSIHAAITMRGRPPRSGTPTVLPTRSLAPVIGESFATAH